MPAGLACEVAFQVGHQADAAGTVVQVDLAVTADRDNHQVGDRLPLGEVQVGTLRRARLRLSLVLASVP
jgi:hypothetical protein